MPLYLTIHRVQHRTFSNATLIARHQLKVCGTEVLSPSCATDSPCGKERPKVPEAEVEAVGFFYQSQRPYAAPT